MKRIVERATPDGLVREEFDVEADEEFEDTLDPDESDEMDEEESE